MPELPQPVSVVTLNDRTATRGPIANDWGNRVHWKVLRDGVDVAEIDARLATSYTLADAAPGLYEIVLETWKHEGYRSGSLGKYVEISNRVSIRV